MNHLSKETTERIKSVFLSGGSVRLTAIHCGVARNSVRKVLRADGLCYPKSPETPTIAEDIHPLDFEFLERMFELGRERGENLKCKEHVLGLAKSFAAELGVTGAIDKIRLQDAVLQYFVYRRFYFKSLEVSDKRYDGVFERRHEKAARAVLDWVRASREAYHEFSRIIRKLEVKYGKRLPHYGGRSVFIQNQVSVQQDQAPASG